MNKQELDLKLKILRDNMVPGITPIENFTEAFIQYTQAVVQYIEERTNENTN